MSTGLEIRGRTIGLLDDPFELELKGGGGAQAVWRARMRDDDNRVWQSTTLRAAALVEHWQASKPREDPVAALASLRPVSIDVRAELDDGRAAVRTFTRLLVGDGVRLRRWRDGLSATLYLPAGDPLQTLLIDTGPDAAAQTIATLAAPLLASHGAVVLAVARGKDVEAPPALAAERLAAVPGAGPATTLVAGGDLPLPAGVAVHSENDTAARMAAWASLRRGLGL